jgi:hypothetical protein
MNPASRGIAAHGSCVGLAAVTNHGPDRAWTRMPAHLFTVEDYLLEHRPTTN